MAVLDEIMEEAAQSIGAKRVFAEPYEKNGVTVIAAARVAGGVGGGNAVAPEKAEGAEGQSEEGKSSSGTGFGAGYGMIGRPAGAFVIKGEDVRWVPAVDVNRLMFGFQVVMVVFFLMIRAIANRRPATVEAATPAK